MSRASVAAPVLALALCAGAATTLFGQAAQHEGPPPSVPPETVSSRPRASGGERLYLEKCAMCHGPGGMGTGLLARRTEQSLLEKRTDLDADYVRQSVRIGIGNMPAIPRGELSDAELTQVADYLAVGKGASR